MGGAVSVIMSGIYLKRVRKNCSSFESKTLQPLH